MQVIRLIDIGSIILTQENDNFSEDHQFLLVYTLDEEGESKELPLAAPTEQDKDEWFASLKKTIKDAKKNKFNEKIANNYLIS